MRVVKILSGTAARRHSGVWVFKLEAAVARHLRRALNFESELSTAAKRRSFKIRSAAIEFKFYCGCETLICAASCGGRSWALNCIGAVGLSVALKFTPKLRDLGAECLKFIPRSLPPCTLQRMLRRAAFSSVGLEILNLATAWIYSGILAVFKFADRSSALRL